jgi:hypothetical protein
MNKKLIIEDIIVYEYENDNFSFEDLKPIAKLSSWDSFNIWMNEQFAQYPNFKFDDHYYTQINGYYSDDKVSLEKATADIYINS